MAITAADSNAALRAVEDLEDRGIGAAWMTSGSTGGGDSLSVSQPPDPAPGASCSAQHNPDLSPPSHRRCPAVLTLAQLAPDRFRLGLGTSGQGGVEQTLGINFRAPLAHLREYVHILKALLQEVQWTTPGAITKPIPVSPPLLTCR